MKKYRISTTISPKHGALLKKHAERLETQQKALELALECLDSQSRQTTRLSPDDELWLRIGMEVKSACIIQRDALSLLMETADLDRLADYITRMMPIVYVIEYYYQKPLKSCTLKEIVEGVMANVRVARWMETAVYTDDGDHYTLKFNHALGIKGSLLHKIMLENVFTAYGAKAQSEVSERSLFIKVFKNNGA